MLLRDEKRVWRPLRLVPVCSTQRLWKECGDDAHDLLANQTVRILTRGTTRHLGHHRDAEVGYQPAIFLVEPDGDDGCTACGQQAKKRADALACGEELRRR